MTLNVFTIVISLRAANSVNRIFFVGGGALLQRHPTPNSIHGGQGFERVENKLCDVKSIKNQTHDFEVKPSKGMIFFVIVFCNSSIAYIFRTNCLILIGFAAKCRKMLIKYA